MTEEKLIKHIDESIENFNALYKEYKREENPGIKAGLRKVLMNGAFLCIFMGRRTIND